MTSEADSPLGICQISALPVKEPYDCVKTTSDVPNLDRVPKAIVDRPHNIDLPGCGAGDFVEPSKILQPRLFEFFTRVA